MIWLPETVSAWGAASFADISKAELERLDPQLLPLQKGLSQGSSVSAKEFGVMILGVSEEAEVLHMKTGIFYASVLTGCHCADDPTPIDELIEYCEVLFEIQKRTACATVTLIV